jgi:predicted HTH transcriptional regulator
VDTNELEQWLEGGEETQSFEVKAAGPRNVKLLVKDILAMANVRDGGVILVGVEDKTFVRQDLASPSARRMSST